MLFRLSTPADNERGPEYLALALAALHRSFRGRPPWGLILAQQDGEVGLSMRASEKFAPVAAGQLQAAYPDLRIQRGSDDELAPRDREICLSARLRFASMIAPCVPVSEFKDQSARSFLDPAAGILAAIAARRGEGLRPFVSFNVRPSPRWLRRTLRLRNRDAEKLSAPLWHVDVWLAVIAVASDRNAAIAKLHELAGCFECFLPADAERFKLSRIRRGTPLFRVPWWPRWLATPAELALLWHPPTQSVQTPQLRLNESRELEPPPSTRLPTPNRHPQLAVLGRASFRDRREVFGVLQEDRFRHTYLIGQTGTGKSTLMLNLAAADITAGRSVVLLDPHGDLCGQLIAATPRRRTNDVIYFDPSDPRPVTYNPLYCRDRGQRPLVASAVVTSFRRLFGNSWGPRLEHILRNCSLTLLENEGTTLLSLHRLLTDEGYRKSLIGRVSDEVVRAFWFNEWDSWKPQFRAEAIAPVQNKVGALVTHPLLRNVLGDSRARLDLRETLDTGRALICNLSKGRLGDDAATLLGSLLVAGVQLAAMSRADQPESERAPAFLFIDEFQNYLSSETIPTLLAEMRKYRLAVTIAHQHRGQLDDATADAVFGNAGTLVAFRLGQDAEVFAEQLGGNLTANDLRSLPKYHAYIRLLIDGFPLRPFSMRTLPPPMSSERRKRAIRRVSKERYGILLRSAETVI